MSVRASGTAGRTRIIVVGLNERALATLKILFARADWKDCELIGTGKPDMAIVDIDTPTPDRTWDDFRARHPDLPALILSLRPQERSGARSLFKPISGDSLRRAVNELKKDITVGGVGRRKGGASPIAAPAALPTGAPAVRHVRNVERPPERAPAFAPIAQRGADAAPMHATHAAAAALDPELDERNCGAAADVDLESQAARAVVGYDPARFFQGLFEQAITHVTKTGQSLEIRGLPAPFLVLAGARVRISSAMRDGVLRSLCVMPLTRGSLSIAPLARVPAASDVPPASAEAMLWQVALWTARGRLRSDVAPDATVWLKRWPNFTRLAATPHAMRIAAMLVASPRSVPELCRDLDIPQRYALSLVNAAAAVGLATAAESSPARVAAPRPAPAVAGATRSLLSRILGRLVPGAGA